MPYTSSYTGAQIDSILDSSLSTASAASTYLTQDAAENTYLTSTDATQIYLTQTDASTTYLTKTSASDTYLTKSSASSTYLNNTGGAKNITRLYNEQSPYRFNDSNPYYAYYSYNDKNDNRWYFRISPATPATISVDWAYGSGAASSIKIKDNVQTLTNEEAIKLLLVRPVSFDYKPGYGEKDQIGFIAEELNEILPKTVININESPSVDFTKFVPYLIKMIQIQQQEINELKQILTKKE